MEPQEHHPLPRTHGARRFQGPSQRVKAPASLLSTTLARLGLDDSTLPPGTQTRVDALTARLGHQEWEVRVAAVRALGALGMPAPTGPLLKALGDEHDAVRAAAARALGKLGERVPTQPLVDALHDPCWSVRAAAVQALGKMGARAPIPPLVEAITDEDETVRAAATQALGEMGERASIDALVLALHDPTWSVREAAALALGQMGRRAPAQELQVAFQDKDAAVRQAAQAALQQTHPDLLAEDPPPRLPLAGQQVQQRTTGTHPAQGQDDDKDGDDRREGERPSTQRRGTLAESEQNESHPDANSL
jgi:hypothetical protein